MGRQQGVGAGGAARTHSVVVESSLSPNAVHTVFTRAEYVQKSGVELGIGDGATARDAVMSVTLGYMRDVHRSRGTALAAGALGTLNAVPRSFEEAYGSRTPLGAMVFLRLRPVGTRGVAHTHVAPR